MFATTTSQMGQKIGRQSRLQDKGFLVLGYLMAMNADQNLDAVKQDSFLSSYGPAMTMLMAGVLPKAKELIEALPTDSEIILADNKAAVLVEIEAAIQEEA